MGPSPPTAHDKGLPNIFLGIGELVSVDCRHEQARIVRGVRAPQRASQDTWNMARAACESFNSDLIERMLLRAC